MERITIKSKMSDTDLTLSRRVRRTLNFKNYPVVVNVVDMYQSNRLLLELAHAGFRNGEVITTWQCTAP